MSDLTVRRLGNGITAILEPRPSSSTAAFGVWIRCGARDEPPGLAGITHWIEHLMFRGPGLREGESRLDTIERLGGNVNGGVGRESLSLQGWVPGESFAELRELLFDMARRPAFDAESIAAESARIRNEGNPGGSGHGWNPATAPGTLRGHALANPILGHPAAGLAPPAEWLSRWWNALFRPERIAVIAAGAFDAEALLRACEDAPFHPDPLAPGADAEPALLPPETSADDAAEGGAIAGTGWVLTAPPLGGAGEFEVRLAERLIASNAAISSQAFHSRLEFCRDRSLWSLWSDTPAGAEALRDALTQLAEHGPRMNALERARQGMQSRLVLEQDDPVWTLERLGEEWSAMNAARSRAALNAGFAAVTAGSLRDALRRSFASAAPFGWSGN